MMKIRLFLFFTITFLFALGLPVYAQQWASTYGGTAHDDAWAIRQTPDGGYIVAGDTASYGAGSSDIWMMKVDATGNISWQKSYGGTDYDVVFSMGLTSDGGYIVAGDTESFGAGGDDAWVLKLDASGNILWQKSYGGTGDDEANAVMQTADGGYIVSGRTESFGAGNSDAWVLKLDASGNVSWQKSYGGSGYDDAYDVRQTTDGGYIVAGDTESFGAGGSDAWVLKLDASGNILWQKSYGGTGDDEANAIRQTTDGGYIVSGRTKSFGAGDSDAWVLKLDASGNISWQKTYGGTAYDDAFDVRQTTDDGYIIIGDTESFGAGNSDMWLLKVDSSGNISWQRTYGGTDNDYGNAILQTSDGGYMAAGQTFSFGAGDSDSWLLKLDGNGNIVGCSPIGTSAANAVNAIATVNNTTSSVTVTAVTPQNSSAAVNITPAANAQDCYANSSMIPLPVGQQTFIYVAPVLAALSAQPAQAQPVGIGDVAAGGADLAINVASYQFEAPVDIYFLLYSESVDPANIYQFTSSGQFRPFSAGLAPWIPASTGPVNANLFGTIPVSDLPPGTYLLGLAVMPAGDHSLTNYYLWVTEFTVAAPPLNRPGLDGSVGEVGALMPHLALSLPTSHRRPDPLPPPPRLHPILYAAP